MEGDARYVDITPQLQMTGATWEDIVAFMNLRSMHPLKPTLKDYIGHVNSEMDSLLRKIPGDIIINKMWTDIPLMFVHVGALDTVVEVFRMTTYDANSEYLQIIKDIKSGLSRSTPSNSGLELVSLDKFYQEAVDICASLNQTFFGYTEASQKERRNLIFQKLERAELITNVLRTELEIRRTTTAVAALK